MSIELFVDDVRTNPPVRVPGTAVFMDSSPQGTPPALPPYFHLPPNRVIELGIQLGI